MKLTIAHIASEVEPYSRTGGLAKVLGSLPSAHIELGYETIVITPFYEQLIPAELLKELEVVAEKVEIELSKDIFEKVTYYKIMYENTVPVYFVAHSKFFGARSSLYGAKNDNARFMLFDIAALHLMKLINFKPTVINCHDWHTGLIPYFLKWRYKKDEFWRDTAVLFTIHNLAFQFGHDWWSIPSEHRDDGRSALPMFDDEALEGVNFAKRGIMNADAINAVSETYREEIMTKDFGEELHRVLKNREKIVFGIVNGINYDEFNPLTDPGIYKHYSHRSVNLKRYNKKWLQRHYALEVNPDVPIICMTSRVSEQKGFKLFLKIAKILLRLPVQIIIMGDGDKKMVEDLNKIQKEYPKQFIVTPFDERFETSLYAGADMFLLPSRFEPCGINQMIALRYGCVPIVHHIGGLADTIVDYNPQQKPKAGNGFTFIRYSSVHLLIAIVRAIETYKHKRAWKELMILSLREANSWIIPAKKYIDLYKTTIKLKEKHEMD